MAYRQIERKKPIRRILQDTTTENRTFVQNGATARLAIPCWYIEVPRPHRAMPHNVDEHDHIGWPAPGQPDDSCQIIQGHYHPYDGYGWRLIKRYIDMGLCHPIHLQSTAEGYTGVEVAFVDPPTGLTASGELDDYVVRVYINPMCQSAVKEDVDVPYTVFIKGTRGGKQIRDVAAKGILRIVAGPIITA